MSLPVNQHPWFPHLLPIPEGRILSHTHYLSLVFGLPSLNYQDHELGNLKYTPKKKEFLLLSLTFPSISSLYLPQQISNQLKIRNACNELVPHVPWNIYPRWFQGGLPHLVPGDST